MTRSIFDPGGRETERSGSTFGGEQAGNRSNLPPDAVDGEVSEAEARDLTPEERIAAIQETDPDDTTDQ